MYTDPAVFSPGKSYGGSPVKMQDLKVRSDCKLTALARFDPRPDHLRMRPQYPDEFRNVCLNLQAENITIRQLFAPANMTAYQNDYEFCARFSPEEQFIKSFGIVEICDSECELIEQKTRQQSKSKCWLHERTKRVHASNFGRICMSGSKTNFVNLAKTLTVAKSLSCAAVDHGKK